MCRLRTSHPAIAIVAGQPIRVLFVGNSLTQANDLPLMVSALAAGFGVQIQGTDVSQGGFSLEDHWNDRRAPLGNRPGRMAFRSDAAGAIGTCRKPRESAVLGGAIQ